MAELVRRAIADTAEQYDMTLREFACFLSRRHKSIRVDLLGGSLSASTVDDELKTMLKKEESQMEFDAEQYTKLAERRMSNVAIMQEMKWDGSATKFRDAAMKAGVYVSDPSGSQAKRDKSGDLSPEKSRLTPAELETVKALATANVAKAGAPDQVKKWGEALRKRDSEETFITVRIPAKKRDYGYRGIELRRDDIHKAVELLTDAILSAMDDIAELLGEEDVERVQAYIDRSVERAAKG